jgi:Ca-activated chloride channel homolog
VRIASGVYRAAALGLAAICALLVLNAQVAVEPRLRHAPTALEAKPKSNIRVDSELVLVPVSVCDPMNHPVTGLEKEHFRLFEDRIEQTVTHFAMDDEPVAVGLVFDTSASMGPKLRLSRAAAAQFFETGNPEDEYFLVEFNDHPKLTVGLTRDAQEIQTHLTFSQSKGRTALLDAIMLAMHELKRSTLPRKALLIISDGGDNSSRYSEAEVRRAVRENDVLIYAVGVYEPYGRSRSPEESSGPSLLGELAEQTGGRHYPAEKNELPDIAAKIGIEMRNRYVLGYSPAGSLRDGKYHKVEVKLVPPRGLPKLSARWRMGYFAPGQ